MPPDPAQRALRPLTTATEPDVAGDRELRFAVTGDSRPILPRSGYAKVTHRVFAELRLLRPAFVLYTGDIVWGYGASRQELLNDYDRFRALADTLGVPLYNCPGNHEMATDPMAIALLEELGHDLYGSFDVGGLHFVALNTDEYWLEGRITGRQLDWLRADLDASRDAQHVFVFMHRPLFSWFQGDFNPDDAAALHDLFRAHPVRAVFHAHDHFHHAVERDGIRYLTVGGAGAPLYAQPQAGGFAHYVLVTIGDDAIDYNVVEPGHLDVDYVAGNDGIEPVSCARIANTTDRDLLVRNLELRVPRLARIGDYEATAESVAWDRTGDERPVSIRAVRDRRDGSVDLSLETLVPTGTVFRVTAEARLPAGREGLERILIVNADDLGRSAPITDGILRAHDRGIVTSTSLMVRWPDAERAARMARERPELSVGLHLDFGEWRFADDAWQPVYEVVSMADDEAVVHEMRAQLERFRALVGREPTHLDSHQHAHLHEPLRGAAVALAAELSIPLRKLDDRVRHDGRFYGRSREGEPWPEGITLDNLVTIFAGLEPGVTELACHPGEPGVEDPLYDREREQELAVLTDPRLREALDREGIELRSFVTRVSP